MLAQPFHLLKQRKAGACVISAQAEDEIINGLHALPLYFTKLFASFIDRLAPW
jgi:hypothetical protein